MSWPRALRGTFKRSPAYGPGRSRERGAGAGGCSPSISSYVFVERRAKRPFKSVAAATQGRDRSAAKRGAAAPPNTVAVVLPPGGMIT